MDSGVYNPSQIRPPQSITGSNTHVIGSIVYTGNSNRPKVGDMRISWSQSSVQAVSVIAQQQVIGIQQYYVHNAFFPASAVWKRGSGD